jgi:penicillin-insensitive murein endopeptidase
MAAIAVRSLALAALVFAAAGTAADGKSNKPTHVEPHLSEPANKLFGAKTGPTHTSPNPIGFYSHGCLAGAEALPIDGPHWQVMRLSRNRMWGHPNLIHVIEDIANKLPKAGGWDGILIGDLSQPRGGPTASGHASHQVGLDVDIWLTPWPGRTLTHEEREQISAINLVTADWHHVNKLWTPQQIALIKTAAQEPLVERIFVNPAIKKELCRVVHGDRSWLHKVRPYYYHEDHMHVRIFCPHGATACKPQPPPSSGDGCGSDLAWWFKAVRIPKKPGAPRKPLTMAALPAACRAVLAAP